MRRSSLFPSAPAASASSSEDTVAVPISKLAKSRNSLVPQRAPLAPVQANAQPLQQQQPQLGGNKRASLAFASAPTEERPIKLARSSLAPQTAAAAAPVQQAAAPAPRVPRASAAAAPAPAVVHKTELSGGDCMPGYNVSMLQGPAGELWSLEEVRAMQPRYARKKAAAVAPAPVVASKSPMPRASVAAAAAALDSTPDHTGFHSHHPSPTVCTRAAMDDIEAMFKDQSPGAARTPASNGRSATTSSSSRGNAFTQSAGPAVPFSTRSLTKEIPPMADQLVDPYSSRGRPSPVAFAVFTDEEMQTRNIALAAADAARAEAKRSQGVGMMVFVDPDMENKPPAPAAAAAASSFAAAGSKRQALRAVVSVPAEEEEEENEYTTSNSKSYPPLTPIAEVNESDMSHASSAAAAAAAAAAGIAAEVTTEASAEPTDGILDPFDPSQRVQWINELGVLSSAGVVDLTAGPAPFSLTEVANGSTSQLELGDALFQVTQVHALPSSFSSMSAAEKSLTLVAENLLDGGESLLRIGGVSELMEMHMGSTVLSRLLQNDPSSEALIRSLFLLPTSALVWEDTCVTVSPVSSAGTLGSLLSLYASRGQRMDERLVVYYCHELLKLLQILHVNSVLHLGLSTHSIWCRYEEQGAEGWSDTWNADSEGGWAQKGLALSNFSAGIDRTLFAAGTEFKCASAALVAAHPALNVLHNVLGVKAWTESVDLFSLCTLTYEMLFGPGARMDLTRAEDGSISLARDLSASSLQSEVFRPMFDTIFNFAFEPANPQAGLDLIATLLAHFDTALTMEQNNGQAPPHAKAIKALLQQQQLMRLQKN